MLGKTLPQRRLHSVESLAAESGLNSRTLRNVLAARGLVPVEEKVSGLHVFDAEAGRKVAASVQRLTKVSEIGKALTCTRPQADQLMDERLLVPISEGPVTAAGRTWKGVDNRNISRLIAALHADARPVDAVPAGMVPISKAAEKAKCLCVDIVHLILGGFLDTIVRRRDFEGCAALFVDPAEVRAQIAAVMTGLSGSKVFGRLSIPTETGWALVLAEGGPHIRPMIIDGKNGRHRIYRFEETTVAAFQSAFTTPTWLANRHDLPIGIVINQLKQSRIRPAMSRAHCGMDFYQLSRLPEINAVQPHRCSAPRRSSVLRRAAHPGQPLTANVEGLAFGDSGRIYVHISKEARDD